MKTLAILKYAFASIGVVMLGVAVFWRSHTASFMKEASTARGTVVDLRLSTSNNSRSYYPVVQFTAADGTAVEFVSNTGSNPPSYAKGDAIEVFYKPSNPRDAMINGFFSLWGGPLIVGGIGAVFFLIGAGMILAVRYTAQRAAYLRANGVPIQARFQRVELNKALAVNGRNPYRVMAQWQNPQTSEIHVFYSENLWFDPTDYIKNPDLTVYIERGNPKKYLVDVAFLPRLAN